MARKKDQHRGGLDVLRLELAAERRREPSPRQPRVSEAELEHGYEPRAKGGRLPPHTDRLALRLAIAHQRLVRARKGARLDTVLERIAWRS